LYFGIFQKATSSYLAGDESALNYLSQQVIEVSSDRNQRFGTDSSFVADWFNYKYSVPQTRDYFSQGVPYPDWLAWFEKSVWYEKNNMAETQFLLDWNAVDRFFVGEPHFNYQKFEGQEGFSLVKKQFIV